MRNLGSTPDELIAVRSPIATRVVLTRRAGPATVFSGLPVPGNGTLTLSPLTDDLLEDAVPFENSRDVPLTLVFRHAGGGHHRGTRHRPGYSLIRTSSPELVDGCWSIGYTTAGAGVRRFRPAQQRESLAGACRDPASWPPSIASRSSRARATRERIVPTGHSQTAAASA